MKPFELLLPLLAWISFGLAQDPALISAIQHLPLCALSCLSAVIAQSSCDLFNSTCICTDVKLQADIEGCVRQSCTLRESLTTKNITSTICHSPIRNKGEAIRTGNIVLTVVTNMFALLRLIYKASFSFNELGLDDCSVLVSLIIGVPSVVIIDRGIVPSGLGRDVWTLPFDSITDFVRWLYALEILYFIQLAVSKLSLLFFCLRIFPKPIIRRLLWATIAFNILWGTTFVVVAIFQCRPVSSYWISWDKERLGKCIDINALGWSNAAISIALDFWILLLPLSEVFRLQLTWRRKASVAIMFGVGTFVTIVSIIRLQSLLHFAVSTNPTWDQTEVVYWSNVEVNFGIICACLPTWRAMLVRLSTRIFGTRETSQPHYGSESRSQGMKGGGNALAIGGGRSVNRSKNDPYAIRYTKTFEVHDMENDETSLVKMDEFRAKNPKSVE